VTSEPIRRLPLPCCEPPYDDELGPVQDLWDRPALPAATPALQGTLALAFVLPSGLPAVPQPPLGLRLVAEAEAALDAHEFGPQHTGRAALPAPRSWAGRIVQAIVEVLGGIRPASQLVRWTTAEVFDEISGLVLGSGPPGEDAPPRGVVRSVHVTEPADGVAEVCALVRRGSRSTAVALRLEGMDGRWQCTALELG
jgi:hypothetical protein